jgi:hypothetical protein
VLLLLALVAPLIFAWPVLPLQDLPDWVFQAQLFRSKLLGREHAGYELVEALPPNALSTLVLGWAPSLISIELATRLFALLACLLIPLGMLRLIRVHDVRSAYAWLPLLFGFAYPILHGNLNSAIALGAVLLCAAALFEHADARSTPGWLLALLAPTFLYVSHGVAYGVWLGIVVLTPLSAPARARLCAGFLPSVALALHYAAKRGASSEHTISWSVGEGWITYKADTLYKQLAPFSSFDPFFLPPHLLWPLAIANFAFVSIVVVAAVATVRRAFREPGATPSVRAKRTMAIALCAAFLLAPAQVIGLVNPGERLVLPMVVLALSLPSAITVPYRRAAAFAVATLVLVQAGFVGTQGMQAARAMAGLLADSALFRGELSFIHESHFKSAQIEKRSAVQRAQAALPRHYPLLRAALYHAQAREQTVPIFETGLLRAKERSLLVRDLDTARYGRRNLIIVGEPIRVAAIAGALLKSPELALEVKRDLYWILSSANQR